MDTVGGRGGGASRFPLSVDDRTEDTFPMGCAVSTYTAIMQSRMRKSPVNRTSEVSPQWDETEDKKNAVYEDVYFAVGTQDASCWGLEGGASNSYTKYLVLS